MLGLQHVDASLCTSCTYNVFNVRDTSVLIVLHCSVIAGVVVLLWLPFKFQILEYDTLLYLMTDHTAHALCSTADMCMDDNACLRNSIGNNAGVSQFSGVPKFDKT